MWLGTVLYSVCSVLCAVVEVQDETLGAGKVIKFKKGHGVEVATVALVRFKLKRTRRINVTEYVVVEHHAPRHSHIVPW